MESEIALLLGYQATPIVPCCLEQRVGADDVGMDKGAGRFNGSIDMRFGGEMHNRIGRKIHNNIPHGGTVTYVCLCERISRGFFEFLNCVQTPAQRQFIDIKNFIIGVV